MVPVLWPTMLICGPVRVQVSTPEAVPCTTTRRLPVSMVTVGKVPPEGTTMASAVDAQRASWWAMHTPGAAVHSASAVHPRQVLVEMAQMGVVPPQVPLSVHWTHAPLLAQAGAVLPLVVHSVAVVHRVQTWFVQMGVVPEQPAPVRHCTHLFVVVSQTGVAPEQVLFPVHWTQAPLVAQAGTAGFLVAHWLGVLQAVQTFAVQMGVSPEHPALVKHWTHLFVVVSQTGVAPEQVLLSVHWTHVPVAEQAGVVGLLAAHWLAVVQAVQTFAVQMGVAPEHPALVRHCTHLFVVGSQTGVAPEQVLLSMHWTQVPVAEQAGVAEFLAAH